MRFTPHMLLRAASRQWGNWVKWFKDFGALTREVYSVCLRSVYLFSFTLSLLKIVALLSWGARITVLRAAMYLAACGCGGGRAWGLWLTAEGRGQQRRLADDGLHQRLSGRGDGGEAQRGQGRGHGQVGGAWGGGGLLGRRRGNGAGLDTGDPRIGEIKDNKKVNLCIYLLYLSVCASSGKVSWYECPLIFLQILLFSCFPCNFFLFLLHSYIQ